MWDLMTGDPIKILNNHTNSVRTIIISPDGKYAISGSVDETCILSDILSGNAIKILRGHASSVEAIKISPDGKYALSGSNDHTCILWDLISGDALKILKGHTSSVEAVSISPDGKRGISASLDKTCIIWDLLTGKQLARFVTNSSISTIEYCSEGIVLAGGSGDLVILHADKELLCPEIPITSTVQLWDFKAQHYQELSVDCPMCGDRFTPPTFVLAAIKEITKAAGLRLEQSSCLVLPQEAWDEPSLLGNCPNCREKLKFNPFIAGIGVY